LISENFKHFNTIMN